MKKYVRARADVPGTAHMTEYGYMPNDIPIDSSGRYAKDLIPLLREAESLNTTPQRLLELAQDPDGGVSYRVATNPNSTEEVLEAVLENTPRRSDTIMLHPNLTERLAAKIIQMVEDEEGPRSAGRERRIFKKKFGHSYSSSEAKNGRISDSQLHEIAKKIAEIQFERLFDSGYVGLQLAYPEIFAEGALDYLYEMKIDGDDELFMETFGVDPNSFRLSRAVANKLRSMIVSEVKDDDVWFDPYHDEDGNTIDPSVDIFEWDDYEPKFTEYE